MHGQSTPPIYKELVQQKGNGHMNADFSSHRGTAELDQQIERAIKENDPTQIFDLAEQLAALPDGTFQKYKIRFRDAFKRRLSISGLDRAVKEARKSQKRAKITARHSSAPASGQARPRPVVETEGQLRDIVQSALNTLEMWNKDEPTIFVQSGRLVAVHFSEDKSPSIAPLTLSSLRYRMTQAADYVVVRDTSEDVIAIPVNPPLDVVRSILEGMNPIDYPFPPLMGITELPIIRPDGSIHQTPGYDPITKQVYIPGELIIPPIPEKPSQDEVSQSVAMLSEHLLADFPFVDKASRATIIANIITVVIRSAIDGLVPLTLLDAPKQGTGKTLLALIVGIVATGRVLSTNSPTSDDEEWRKRILTWLLSSPSVVIIDNIIHLLESSSLNAALTSGYVEDRLLSTNTSIRVANRAVWFVTGNNIRVGDDTARRCIKCRLDAKSERPHKRDAKQFKIENILKWTIEHRAEIIVAVLTLMRNWYAQGCPEPNCTPLGSFEEWRLIVGGILQSSGIPDFLANLDDEDGNSSIDEVSAAWKSFVKSIYDVYRNDAFTFSELAKRMLTDDEQAENLCESLPTSLTKSFDSYQRSQGRDRDFSNHMGNAFRARKGQVFDDLRLEMVGKDRTGKAKWQIVLNDDCMSQADTPPQEQEQTEYVFDQQNGHAPTDTTTLPIDTPSPDQAPLQYSQADEKLFKTYGSELKKRVHDGKQNLMWVALDSGYQNEMLSIAEHYNKTKEMLNSSDERKRQAAREAIHRTLNTYSSR